MLSVVIPCYNEEVVLPLLVSRLRPVLDGLDVPYEVVFVNDGSTDGTAAALLELQEHWPQAAPVLLARNVGHQVALGAGLDAARGNWVVTMDADLQDPPELVPEMLRVAEAGNVDIVYARRPDRRSDTWVKRRTAHVYYALVRRLTGVELPPHAGDFRLMSGRVVAALRALPEGRKVYRLLLPSLGFPSATVEHVRGERAAGETKYPMRKMVLLAADSIVSFTSLPLRLALMFGFMAAGVCLLLAASVVVAKVVGSTVPGWASITIAMLFLGAVQLVAIGIVGEYVGRIYDEVKRRPPYRVNDAAADVSAAASSCPRCGHPADAEAVSASDVQPARG